MGSIPAFSQISADEGFLTVSERTGHVLSAEDRSYFGLFPNVEGFERAVAWYTEAGYVEFLVTAAAGGSGQVHRVVVEKAVFEEMQKYIDVFETVYNDTRAVDWSKLWQIARPVNHFRKGKRLRVTTADNRTITGGLVFIDDEILVLSSRPHTPSNYSLTEGTTLLMQEEISYLRDIRLYPRRLFSETIHLRTEANDSDYGWQLSGHLETKTVFDGPLSPEIRHFVRRGKAAETRPESRPYEPADRLIRRMRNRIHISLLTPAMHHTVSFPEPTDRRRDQSVTIPRLIGGFQVDYSLLPQLRLGGHLFHLKEGRRAGNPEGERSTNMARLAGRGGGVAATWVVNPLNPSLFFGGGRGLRMQSVEVSLSAGVSWTRFETSYVRRIRIAGTIETIEIPEAVQQTELAWTGGVALDLYLSRQFSVTIASNWLYYPGLVITTPDRPHISERNPEEKARDGIIGSLLWVGFKFHMGGRR